MPNVDEIMSSILEEAHRARYTIHPSSIKMYHDLSEVCWLYGLKRDISEFLQCVQIFNK